MAQQQAQQQGPMMPNIPPPGYGPPQPHSQMPPSQHPPAQPSELSLIKLTHFLE